MRTSEAIDELLEALQIPMGYDRDRIKDALDHFAESILERIQVKLEVQNRWGDWR